MNTLPFPRELYDIVINHFHDDIPTLKTIALVDRASANICQSYIFRQITLRTQGAQSPVVTETPCFKLHDILLASPHLATRVKDLTVDNRELYGYDPEKYPHVTLVTEDDFLPTVLDALPYITCIQLLLHSPTWSSLTPRLQSSIERAFASDHLLSITVLALHDIPLSLFCASSGLNRLCLLDTTIEESEVDSDTFNDHFQLGTLDLIVDDPRQLLDEASPFDLTNLQRCSIALGLSFRHDLQPFTMLLEDNADTLEYLGLHICRLTTLLSTVHDINHYV
jgi:hypothetical protein